MLSRKGAQGQAIRLVASKRKCANQPAQTGLKIAHFVSLFSQIFAPVSGLSILFDASLPVRLNGIPFSPNFCACFRRGRNEANARNKNDDNGFSV